MVNYILIRENITPRGDGNLKPEFVGQLNF